MRTRSIAWGALAALLTGTPALAQQHQGMQHGQQAQHAQMSMAGMQGCMDMMGGPSATMILHHRQQLGLSAEQVTRLEALKAKDSSAAMPHMKEAMAAHQAAVQALRADQPDFAAYEAKLREAANHAVLGHVAMARAAADARAVLTADQRTKLEAAMKDMKGMDMQGMAGMQGMGGMQGMMMHCAMMGGMSGQTMGAPGMPAAKMQMPAAKTPTNKTPAAKVPADSTHKH